MPLIKPKSNKKHPNLPYIYPNEATFYGVLAPKFPTATTQYAAATTNIHIHTPKLTVKTAQYPETTTEYAIEIT